MPNIPCVRQQRLYLICILFMFCVGMIIFKAADTNEIIAGLPPLRAIINGQEGLKNTVEEKPLPKKITTPNEDEGQTLETVLKNEREKLLLKFHNYTFHPALKTSSLAELVPELGGKQVHNLVMSTWRSGSTFLGELLNRNPGSFYHYEPLLPYGINQLRFEPLARPAMNDLLKLMKCDYSDMEHYIEFGKNHDFLFSHTPQIRLVCKEHRHLCFQPRFLEAICKVFPFQQMKVVRLRTRYSEEFLSDESLRAKVLLLIRDPRGTLQSRKHRDWCPMNPDCFDAEKLCDDMLDDYYSAKSLSLLFKDSFRVIRYEDLSFDIYNKSKNILDFFSMSYHPDVAEFLASHTKSSSGGVSSTFRNSKTAPIHWKDDLSWEEVEYMQKKCDQAIELWGYKMAANESHLRSFNPIGEFGPEDMNILS